MLRPRVTSSLYFIQLVRTVPARCRSALNVRTYTMAYATAWWDIGWVDGPREPCGVVERRSGGSVDFNTGDCCAPLMLGVFQPSKISKGSSDFSIVWVFDKTVSDTSSTHSLILRRPFRNCFLHANFKELKELLYDLKNNWLPFSC